MAWEERFKTSLSSVDSLDDVVGSRDFQDHEEMSVMFLKKNRLGNGRDAVKSFFGNMQLFVLLSFSLQFLRSLEFISDNQQFFLPSNLY